MQVQIQALLAAGATGEEGREATGSNLGPQMEVAKPSIFSGEAGRVGGFVTACILYLRMKMRSNSRGTSTMDSLICPGRISRCVEREHNGGIGSRRGRI